MKTILILALLLLSIAAHCQDTVFNVRITSITRLSNNKVQIDAQKQNGQTLCFIYTWRGVGVIHPFRHGKWLQITQSGDQIEIKRIKKPK